MDETGRLQALQEGENRLATMQGREPAEVVSDPTAKPGEFGGYNGEMHQISFGSFELEHGGVSEAANTLAHEGRHAYQQWAVDLDHPGFHDNAAEVDAWRENMKPENYVRPEQNYRRYLSQPVEADAWRYGDAVAGHLYGGR
jgi:hypothetical protein